MQELVSSSPPASAASECFCEQADKENCGWRGSYPWTSCGKQGKKLQHNEIVLEVKFLGLDVIM